MKIPKWEALPSISLYMDQVVLLINERIAPEFLVDGKGLTPSMVNNYVKNSYIKKPEKKKYDRHHLATLLMITYSKAVFSIKEIAWLIEKTTEIIPMNQLYSSFAMRMNGEKSSLPPVFESLCDTLCQYKITKQMLEEERCEDFN